jgi:hypothetical protein
MADAERIWREKSDEDLLDAAAELDQFTEEGQRVIRAELRRRGLEDPVEQAGEETDQAPDEPAEPVLECLRCHETLRYIDPDAEPSPRWQWAGRRAPLYDPSGLLHVYACPRCGHVELFMDLPDEEPPDEERPD